MAHYTITIEQPEATQYWNGWGWITDKAYLKRYKRLYAVEPVARRLSEEGNKTCIVRRHTTREPEGTIIIIAQKKQQAV